MKKYIKLLRIKYHMIMQMFHTKEACIHYEAFKRLTNEYAADHENFHYDHAGKVCARTSNNTLTVEADETGVFVRADLSKDSAARSMFEDLRRLEEEERCTNKN